MSNVNGIQLGVYGSNSYFTQQEKEDLTQTSKKEANTENTPNRQMESSEILGYMAAQSAAFVPVQKPLDVSQYVSAEEEERIAASMEKFVATEEAVHSSVKNEDLGLSDEAETEISLAYMNHLMDNM
ncbi:MAG: hypothetical protein LUG16_01050 [Candidatus Gastranaerophilales bacterium]|nr:hypothetical protein [Candidatus Gastranaerophilales bacterium]